MDTFAEHIKNGKLPMKAECLKVIEINEVLKDRHWKNIKDYVRNHKKQSVSTELKV